ncbi:hypothetical protein [Paraburkholderia humisilvae]|uniref:Uncharacterized protein n=1 Tax=Paraburkholderia humisilvae TaxID=627669 RepID=A0A6J5DLM2_9BURK|nr:hypothetical protein [Paraburkholderia humisilvae]CAB3754873.1 hypothetical protein LMG29542_02475 [Paraburkholderia humisilvae]
MTALSLLSQELGLSALEHRFAHAMLGATPLAASGGTAMVPVATLMKAVEPELEPEEMKEADVAEMLRNGVGVVLAGLLRQPRTFRDASASVSTSFCVLDSVTMANGAEYVQIQLSRFFLDLLGRVAVERGIASY